MTKLVFVASKRTASLPRNLSFLVGLSLALSTGWNSVSADEQSPSPQDESPNDDHDEQKYREELQVNVAKFLATKTSREAGQSRLKLFSTPFDRSVEDLMIHENPHVAIQAAWMRYSRMVPRRGLRFGGANESIDPRDLERFLGFLEGRARILVPDWWERALADPDHNLSREEPPARCGWTDLSKITLASNMEEVTLDWLGDELHIPAKTLHDVTSNSQETYLGLAIKGQTAVLLEYNEFAARSNLICFDLGQSKELWRNVSWGTGGEQVPVRTGPASSHHMSIEINENRVFVFGAMTSGYDLYVEGFAIKDGTPVVRFSTNNWMIEAAREQD